MSVGYAGGGLDDPGFDEDQAANDVGNIEDDERKRQAAAEVVPDLNPEDTQQGAPGASEPHTLDAAGSTPAPATDAFPTPPQFPELGPPPPPPAPTGDPQKDVAANLLWQRALTEHHGELTKRQTALAKYAADVGAMKGKKEAEVAQVEATQKAAEVKRAAEDRIARQAAVDAAVRERVAAAKDVEGITWDKSRPRTGSEIAAIILGGVAASLSNVARIQVGQAPTAENEAVKAIDARMKREYEAKKHRYAAAGDAVLMAKYQVTTADQAHRAAMNDINADMAAKYRLIAKQAEDATLQAGGTLAQAKGNLVSVDALQKAAVHEGDIANREEGHADQRKQAAATLAVTRASLGERRREFDEGAANRDADRKAKADEKKAKEDAGTEVRNGRGLVVGHAPSSRVVKPMEDRLIQYDDAIKSTEDLLAYVKEHGITGRIPTGDQYDRAVLAVAATTQANASDATTAHEAGTLKKYGLVSPEAVERTLEHLRIRQAAFLKQLRPVDGGEETPRAAPAGTKRTPAKKGFDAPGGVRYEMGDDGNYHKVK